MREWSGPNIWAKTCKCFKSEGVVVVLQVRRCSRRVRDAVSANVIVISGGSMKVYLVYVLIVAFFK